MLPRQVHCDRTNATPWQTLLPGKRSVRRHRFGVPSCGCCAALIRFAASKWLQILGDSMIGDINLENAIVRALRLALEIDESGVELNVSNGHVRIRGHVRNSQERDLVESEIRKMPGVTRVENCLTIR